ncbi:MAG: hypothetical protein QOI38_795 [Sphingomonadales bacterium]|jgi:hypothetical protein|nr:hypothetical protein [Sphingomonadales bacterium]
MKTAATLLAAGAALLAGCAPRAVGEVAPAASGPVRRAPPPTQATAGLEAVIGRTAAMLTARFGAAALDIREGDARKLQFESASCILDAYLYPPAAGREPIVTHIDARLPDGRDMDRASCVAALAAARARR